MRPIVKRPEPLLVTEARCGGTTLQSGISSSTAREEFDRISKPIVRHLLAVEQGWLCAFCMRRVDHEGVDANGQATLKIAHLQPIKVAPAAALVWSNLVGSCDCGHRSGHSYRTCDAAQGSTPLVIDPTSASMVARVRFERRGARTGLFITCDDADLRRDVEQILALNAGDLPDLREQAWKAFLALHHRAHPRAYGKAARCAYLPSWRDAELPKLPEMAGLIEAQLR